MIEGEFPFPYNRVMAQDVNSTIIALNLEIAMIRGQPLIEDCIDCNRP